MERSKPLSPRELAVSIKHIHRILGGGVTGSPWRKRAPAQSTDSGLKARDAQLNASKHTGQRHTVGVMQMQTDVHFGEFLLDPTQNG